MKVWALIGRGHYGGGLAIIAAESADAAKKLGGTIHDRIWNTDYLNPSSIEQLNLYHSGSAKVITHYEIGE